MSVVPACVLFNARSLRNKLSELHLMLYHDNPSLVFVTESWLDSSITDGMIDPQGLYCVYRRIRIRIRLFNRHVRMQAST